MTWAQADKTNGYVRCYSVEHDAEMRAANPKMLSPEQSKAQFEQWMAEKIAERRANPDAQRRATYTIPYVVHVVHSGEAVGSGANISKALVDEQMQQLNEDFRRENADTVNTPIGFLPVADGIDIEFLPAIVDPDGNIMPEPGINRIDGLSEFGISSWGTGSADATLKPNTVWDRSFYMNVWSADLNGGLLGYAQFPSNSTLPGFNDDEGPANTDGVVILYSSVGGLDLPGTAVPYELGRTLTHELGHWIGLRHIWGDGGCGVDDYCDDTPEQSGSHGGCATGVSTCGSVDMPENYMDYSEDACFNIFTMDQLERVEVVLENSPGRADLLESTTWMIPATDTIIAGIDADDNSGCAPLVINFADNSYSGPDADPITSYEWNFDVDGLGGASPATFSGATPGAVTFTNVGTYTVSLDIDNGTYTGTTTYEVTVEGSILLDVSEGFEAGIPASWASEYWVPATPGYASSSSIYHNCWSIRDTAFLTTPSVDMDVMATYITLSFDVSHANYSLTGLGADEGMAVEYSTDCGATWTEIWSKLDSDPDPFYTVGPNVGGSQWAPAGDGEWRNEEVDLSSLMGEAAVKLRFVGISDFGHDTYLDNILIEAVTVSADDVIADLSADPTSGCSGLEVTFTNLSTSGSGTTLNSWEWDFDVTGVGGASPSTFSGETPPVVTYTTGGTYTAGIAVSDGVNFDTASLEIEVEASVAAPVVEDFESGIPVEWENPQAGDYGIWQLGTVGYMSSAAIFQYNWNNSNADNAVLVTQPIDLSGPADEATLSFQVAHAHFGGGFGEEEGMSVEYSLDCGATWTVIYLRLDSDADPFYTTQNTTNGWLPTPDDWRMEELDIIGLIGNAGVKFRFTSISDYGNDTYVDDINIDVRVVDANTIETEFSAEPLKICEGQSIEFTDLSLIGTGISGTTWDWDFDATGTGTATPATFSGQTPPAIVFETGGIYTVELTVSGTGSAGAVSNSFSLDVEVEGAGTLPIAEDFESGVFPPAGWIAESSEVGGLIAAPVGFQSDNSAFWDNFTFPDLRADLTLPSLDFDAVGRAELTFDLSHTYYNGIGGPLYDTLALAYSIDCGGTWVEFWRKDDGDVLNPLFTADASGAGFVPTSDDDWRAESVDVTFLQGNGNVKIRFEGRGGYGNSMFIDNINIDAELVGPDEVFAYYTVEDGAGCLGSAITFIEASTAGANTVITSWEWDFDATGVGGADPATFSGENPPAVTFTTPGDYTVILTVSDGSVSDDYSTVISFGGSEDLTFTENFAMTEFPPAGWVNVLWEQAAESSDPLLGSLFADNWNVVGLQSKAWTPALDMSWYDQIEMTFDVAHARFSGNENEGVVISGSSDCGASYDEVWSKYDFDADPLYTTADFEAEWFPEDADDWREESVDLSVFNDNNAVSVEIYNDGAWGNNTFVDGINIEGWLFNPTDLTATTDGNDVELSWTDNSGKESNYDVMRKTPGMADFELVATVGADETSYTDNNLDGPEYYTYQVCAWNEKARACSNEDSDSIAAVLLVEGLVAILVDTAGTSIELFWSDESTTEDGFIIKRSTDGVNFTVINHLTPNQEYYIDEFLDETTVYYYQVCAYNEDEVAESNIADETTDINSPSNLIATADGININLSWTDNSLVEENYQIKRSETSGGPYTIVTVVPANVTAYTDFNREENTEYCYIVCAYNSVATGCGPEDCATTGLASTVFDDLNAAITIYPNPATNYFELELSGVNGDINVSIFNQIGEVMYDDMLFGGAARRIELDNFASGMYMIRLQTDDGFTTKKLIVE
ncbi:MAG: T9SS type A sorting domain-containing protein [Bacteroidetes bacterium]|nr:T9SS type A sorting domain-containing protein [Bacteroidota bacterium]